ncbi:hypothetical protein NUU61_005033 [Penicillium alfredii]|uniref:Uncharacterized protein n=1 Tax=Penicillium alfredii TaxID=1506179 RepID=A0A9W9F925_9EURO|nr:uncharacterized protein NUU61_005033 [Penicillium alfredii]KAJ5095677.1 hypothetical protein NUU61_005033 [Penicillium alfredii]
MKNDYEALIQSAQYYNSSMFPDLVPALDLGRNENVYSMSPEVFSAMVGFPDHVRLGMVCTTLSHCINRSRGGDSQSTALTKTFYRYRGLIIRSLCDDINVEHKRTSPLVIAGMLNLLLADAHQGVSPHWRYHLEGAQKLIMLRGGMRSLVESTGVAPLLRCFVLIAVIGDTSSPAYNLAMSTLHMEELEFMVERFGGEGFAFLTFPAPLFAEIMKINLLRAQASKLGPNAAEDFAPEAYDILNRVFTFSSEQWAAFEPPSTRETWIMLGNLHQAAVVVYCISSLQSLSILPSNSVLRGSRLSHGQLLQKLLCQALPMLSVKRFMIWPLVVLGVEAVNGGVPMRNFVRKQLEDLGRHMATCVPLTAKDVLERFWASGETRWDACFDKPYVFSSQIAVNVGQLR